jgi:hypothetical protein
MPSNHFEALCNSIGHALHGGFSDIEYMQKARQASRDTGENVQFKDYRKHQPHDIEVAAMFVQTWGSTALGFGGIGGAAMTDAYTVILKSLHTNEHLVYFDGRFAYSVKLPNMEFYEDISLRNMAEISQHGKYERRIKGSK